MAGNYLALMYDFDHTLSPRDMQEYAFIPELGMEADAFWHLCRRVGVQHRMDDILAYMFVMLGEARKRGMPLNRATFNRQGERVVLYPGLDTWFDRINAFGRSLGYEVEHYVLSSGLTEIIEGSPIAERFRMIYAAQFVYDEVSGEPVWPAMAINYTSKTQYIYRINKGVLDVTDNVHLNEHTPHDQRRIPFANMIYIGDGSTDIPCMKLVKSRGGHAIGVYERAPNPVVDDMLYHGRIDFLAPTDYREGGLMETIVKAIFRSVAASSELVGLNEQQLREAEARLK